MGSLEDKVSRIVRIVLMGVLVVFEVSLGV